MAKRTTSQKDYDASMLPKNRKEVFFDVMKLNLGRMLMYGCLMLLFALPIHAFAIAEDFYTAQLMPVLQGDFAAETKARAAMSILSFNMLRNALDIPLFMLLSVGLAGMARVIRQYAWGEPVDFNHDFALGVKQNVKQFSLIAFLTGVVVFILNACLKFNDICILLKMLGADTIEPNDAYTWISIIPAALCAVFLIPIAGYALVAGTCYENKLRHNLKIGRVCYFRSLWKTLFACICCLAVYAIQLLPFFGCHIAGRVIGSVLIPEIMLGWYLFAFGTLDEAVNKKLHPELVGRGVYQPPAVEE